MYFSRTLLVLLALATAPAVVPAYAQTKLKNATGAEAQTISLTVQSGAARYDGELTKNDGKDTILKTNYAKVFLVDLRATKRYSISMSSVQASTHLRVEDAVKKVLASETNSQFSDVIFQPPRDGKYRIVATTAHAMKTGPIVIEVVEVSAEGELLRTLKLVNGTAEYVGELTQNDPKDTAQTSSFVKRFSIELRSGKVYAVSLGSRQAGALLRIEDSAKNVMASESNVAFAQSIFRPRVDGVYRLIATTPEPNKTGAIVLNIRELVGTDVAKKNAIDPKKTNTGGTPATAGVLPLTFVNQVAQYIGTITNADAKDRLNPSSYVKAFSIDLQAGKRYAVSMYSRAGVNVRLENSAASTLGSKSDAQYAQFGFNPSSSGNYRIFAVIPGDGKTGGFSVTVRELAEVIAKKDSKKSVDEKKDVKPTPTPVSKTIALTLVNDAAQYDGSLTSTDDKDTDPRRRLSFQKTFSVRFPSGKKYVVDLRSAAFDTILSISDANGNQIAFNDDADGGLNSRINFQPLAAGTYFIKTTTYRADAVGPFQLRIGLEPVNIVDKGKTNPGPDTRRPFYIIGHHANTEYRFDAHVNGKITGGGAAIGKVANLFGGALPEPSLSANMMEFDIHPYGNLFGSSIRNDQIYVAHFFGRELAFDGDEFTREYTSPDKTEAYLRNAKKWMDSGHVLGVFFDVKSMLVVDGPLLLLGRYPYPRDYGRVVGSIAKRIGIDPNRVIIGVDATTNASGKSGSEWAKEFIKGVRYDAQYDCLFNVYFNLSGDAGSEVEKYMDSDVAETGTQEAARSNFSNWKPYLEKFVELRDRKKSADLLRDSSVRFVYFWTVNSKADMEAALDVGVDGMITDYPVLLKQVLLSEKYRSKYRIAGRDDQGNLDPVRAAADFPIPKASRTPRSLVDPDIQITCRNDGWYDAKYVVEWTSSPGNYSNRWESGKCMRLQSDAVTIPRNADYRVKALWSNGSSYAEFREGWQYRQNGGGSRTFANDGTLFSGGFGER